MNNISENKSSFSGYTDVFTCMGFTEAHAGVHIFEEHTLLYVYSGSMEVTDGNATEYVETGRCAFIRKGETLRLTVIPTDDECHVMMMTLPRPFLCELYHCRFCGHGISDNEKEITGHILPENAATTSLFQSLVPFYEFGMEIPQNLYRLKMTEAIVALLTQFPESHKWLFDFSVNPLNLLDVVAIHKPSPLKWSKINIENAFFYN